MLHSLVALMKKPFEKFSNRMVQDAKRMLVSEMGYNIEFELKRRALMTTVDYVQSRMANAKMLSNRRSVLEDAIKSVELEGFYAEFGVRSGGTINFIASLVKDKVYGFDSFEGLPEEWRAGRLKGQYDQKGKLPKVNANVELVKGWFSETLPGFSAAQNQKAAFLHLDADIYSSTKTVFDCLKRFIVPGTILVFDEYFNYHPWEQHEYKAFQEFVAAEKIRYQYLAYSKSGCQVSVKIVSKGL